MLAALLTERLALVPTPVHVMVRRLRDPAEFIDAQPGEMEIRYPRDWPGPAISLFPAQLERLALDPSLALWTRTMVNLADRAAVGQLGFKAPPDRAGRVELGYGVNPSCWGRGYATEAGRGLVGWAWDQPGVQSVVAECLETNYASRRVLEKVGFAKVGRRFSAEGLMLMWEHRRTG